MGGSKDHKPKTYCSDSPFHRLRQWTRAAKYEMLIFFLLCK